MNNDDEKHRIWIIGLRPSGYESIMTVNEFIDKYEFMFMRQRFNPELKYVKHIVPQLNRKEVAAMFDSMDIGDYNIQYHNSKSI